MENSTWDKMIDFGKTALLALICIAVFDIAKSVRVIASPPEHETDTVIQTSGKYTIDLPEEIDQSNGDDLAIYKQGNLLHVYFPHSVHPSAEQYEQPLCVDPREYQMEIDKDSIYLYDRNKRLCALKYDQIGLLDSVLLKDNL